MPENICIFYIFSYIRIIIVIYFKLDFFPAIFNKYTIKIGGPPGGRGVMHRWQMKVS